MSDCTELAPEDELSLQFYKELSTSELLYAVYELESWIKADKLTDDMKSRCELTLEVMRDILSGRESLLQ